jgi:rod shape determining protein RodA
MSRSSLVPEPLARLPWRMILTVIAIGTFGQIVL